MKRTRMAGHPRSIPAEFFTEGKFGSNELHVGSLTNGEGFSEELFPVSIDPNIFGVLTRPQNWNSSQRPLILLLNSGAVHHVGPGRTYVELARRLAESGFASLRMDLCGLGDSIVGDHERENIVYVETMFRDVEIAIDQLKSRLNIDRCVIAGICSGAYAAFQTAVQFDAPTIVESVLINPLTFSWQDGMTLETSPSLELIEEHQYLQSAFKLEKWLKLLSGKSNIGITGAIRLLKRRLWRRHDATKTSETTSSRVGCSFHRHPTHRDIAGDLKRAIGRGRHLTMFFSSSDPGFGILSQQAGSLVNEFRRRGELDISFIDHADHTFSRRGPRTELFDGIISHLKNRYSD